MLEPFITTYSGRRVNPLALLPQDVCIEDVEHHLALLPRFVGATEEPLSVAQHAVCVSLLLDKYGPMIALLGLHHDDSEAYLGEVTKWVKHSPMMAAYRKCEDDVQAACYSAFRVLLHDTLGGAQRVLEEADRLMARIEAHTFLSIRGLHMFEENRNGKYPPPTKAERMRLDAAFAGWHADPYTAWNWRAAKAHFRSRHRDLTEKLYGD